MDFPSIKNYEEKFFNSSMKKSKKKLQETKPTDELTNVKTFDKDLSRLKKKKQKARLAALFKRSAELRKKHQQFIPGIIYLSHIPDGFTPMAMRDYFSQFGDVGRLRVALSHKTGKSKGFAFVEFKCDEVAKIVAETMNNYYMFEKLLKCRFIPQDEVKYNVFRGFMPNCALAHHRVAKLYNKPKDQQQQQKSIKKRLTKLAQKQKHLAKLGIDFKFPTDDIKQVEELKFYEEKQALKKLKLKNKEDKQPVEFSAIEKDQSDSELSFESSDEDQDLAEEEQISSEDEPDQQSLSFGNVFSVNDVSDTSNSKYTLELDSSDDEISFNTPPNARKKIKNDKSLSNPKSPEKGKIVHVIRPMRKKNQVSTPKMAPNAFIVNDVNKSPKPNSKKLTRSIIQHKKSKKMLKRSL